MLHNCDKQERERRRERENEKGEEGGRQHHRKGEKTDNTICNYPWWMKWCISVKVPFKFLCSNCYWLKSPNHGLPLWFGLLKYTRWMKEWCVYEFLERKIWLSLTFSFEGVIDVAWNGSEMGKRISYLNADECVFIEFFTSDFEYSTGYRPQYHFKTGSNYLYKKFDNHSWSS